jgi:hypothetical protein
MIFYINVSRAVIEARSSYKETGKGKRGKGNRKGVKGEEGKRGRG